MDDSFIRNSDLDGNWGTSHSEPEIDANICEQWKDPEKPEPDKMHMVENDMNTTKYKEQAGNSAGNPLSAIPITTSISDSSNDKTLKKTMTNRTKTY